MATSFGRAHLVGGRLIAGLATERNGWRNTTVTTPTGIDRTGLLTEDGKHVLMAGQELSMENPGRSAELNDRRYHLHAVS
jgi:hypothetical protein